MLEHKINLFSILCGGNPGTILLKFSPERAVPLARIEPEVAVRKEQERSTRTGAFSRSGHKPQALLPLSKCHFEHCLESLEKIEPTNEISAIANRVAMSEFKGMPAFVDLSPFVVLPGQSCVGSDKPLQHLWVQGIEQVSAFQVLN